MSDSREVPRLEHEPQIDTAGWLFWPLLSLS